MGAVNSRVENGVLAGSSSATQAPGSQPATNGADVRVDDEVSASSSVLKASASGPDAAAAADHKIIAGMVIRELARVMANLELPAPVGDTSKLDLEAGRAPAPTYFEEIEQREREGVGADSPLPQEYQVVRNLVEIEDSRVHKKALEYWTSMETLSYDRVNKADQGIANGKNEIYQLIGFFTVFQGVLLTAVTGSNLLHCNNLWSPIFLSVLASGVSVVGVIQKLKHIHTHKEYGIGTTRVFQRVLFRVLSFHCVF